MPSLSANELTLTIKAVDQASAVLKRVQDSVDGVSKESDKGASAVQRLRNNWAPITAVAAASTTAFSMLGGSILQSVGDFQQGMSVFQQISGATAGEMTKVQAKAKDLGNDIRLPGVSAKTAADAMTELAKAGLSVNDTLDASRGVLALAKAGQLDTAQAAEITANALLAFNLRGTEATRVADLLAAAANASSSDVSGIGQSMAQVSAVAAQTKRPVEDVVTQIALLANQGIKGSDAGTSLKTMLMALTPKSKEAAEAMSALGINAYDAQGKMKSTREIIGMYSEKLAKMTDEQRDQTLQTIFGSDAMRAASILIRGGTAEYDKMSASVTKAGAAQKNAASYTNGLKGNVEAINSSLETMSLTIGQKVLPFVEALTGTIAGWVSDHEELATAIAVGGIALLGLLATVTALAGAVGLLVPAIGAVAAILGVTGAVATGVFFGIPLAVAACVALIFAYWEPISGFFSGLWDDVKKSFQTATDWISDRADWVKGEFVKAIDKVKETYKNGLDAINRAIKESREWFEKYEGAIKGVATTLGVIFGPALLRAATVATIAGAKIAISGVVAGAGWVAAAAVASAAWIVQMARIVAIAAISGARLAVQATLAGAAWVVQASVASAAWVVQMARVGIAAALGGAIAAAKAADAGWAWVINGARIGIVWIIEMAKIVAAGAITSARSAVHAAASSAVWVAAASRASLAWVITELPRIVIAFATTAAASALHAGTASAAWIASASRAAIAWVLTELPRIVIAFAATSAAGVASASVASGAWIAAASASAVAWVLTELPRIMVAFGIASGAAVVNAAIAAGAWIASAASSSAAVTALSVLVATPMVMPAILIGAALAALGVVIAKTNETIGAVKSLGDSVESSRKSGESTDAAIRKMHDDGKISTDKLNTYLRNTSNVADEAKNKMYSGFFGPVEKALDGLFVKITGTQDKYKGSGFGGFATGTNYAPGGLTWVGERGPELVNLPRGSQVYTNSQSRQMSSAGRGGEVVINVAHQEIRNENDAKSWARQLGVRVNP